MAASQNLTASALYNIQAALLDLFPGPNPTEFTRYAPGNSFNALAANNRANVELIRDTRGRCISLDVYHLPYSISTEATVSGSAPTVACEITPADYRTTKKTTYTQNLYGNKIVSVDDDTCGDLFSNPSTDGATRAARYVAQSIEQGMQSMRNELDKYIATFLHSNRQTADYAPGAHIPPLAFDAALDAWPLDYDYFKTPDTFTMLDAMMANNGIGTYFTLGGIGGFYNAQTNAQWRQQNDNERFLSRFGTARLAFDIFNLDAAVNTAAGTSGQAYTFLIPDGSYVFANFSDYTPDPVRYQYNEKPTWLFSVQDPILRILENGVLRPVVYDVHYQAVCNGSDTRQNFTATHSFQIMFKGLLSAAPTDTAGRTGIMELVTTPGI